MSAPNPYRDHPDGQPRSGADESELDKKLAQYARIGLPIATVGIALLAGTLQGPAVAVLVLAGGMLIGVIAMFWASVRTLVGETPLSGADAHALGAPRAEEEQKRAVLRALKDLEFEHAVGKISDADYQDLVAKYRAEAKRLLRSIDAEAGPRRAQIEAMVNKRLRREGLLEGGLPDAIEDAGAASPGEAPAPKARKRKKNKEPARPAASAAPAAAGTRVCSECRTVNDSDAVFCKKCGARQGAPQGDDAARAEGEAS